MPKNSNVVVGIVVVGVVLGLGLVLFKSQTKNNKVDTGSPQQEVQERSQNASHGEVSGQVLAGKSAPYKVFSKTEYDEAIKSGKVVFLDFFANWCPICRAEEPDLKAGFDSLTTDKVIGFRVNWQDSDTDEDEKKLAQEFGVLGQHTKFILKNGKIVFGPDRESWDKQTTIDTINKFAQ